MVGLIFNERRNTIIKLILLLVLSVPIPAQAHILTKEHCEYMAGIAERYAVFRDQNVPIEAAVDEFSNIVKSSENTYHFLDEDDTYWFKSVIKWTYANPSVSSAIIHFHTFTVCMTERGLYYEAKL